ncbi:MAG TPA: MFS transporter, partial [Sphingomonas sp.]|nr:MFS transporter [Sphingomonas sp.]
VDVATILPPLPLIAAALAGVRPLLVNLAGLGVVVAVALFLIKGLGEPPMQWIVYGIGVYAVFSWASTLKRRDPPTYALIVGNPAFVCVVLAYGLNAFLSYAVTYFAPPYAIRTFGVSAAEAGFIIGGMGAASGFLGVTIGGGIADRLRRTNPAGRLVVVIFGAVVPAAFIVTAYSTPSVTLFYLALFPAQMFASCALGAAAATTQDLVLPRMRGTATATFFLGTTLIGLALGPYLAGRVSTLTGSLSTGVISLLLTVPITLAAAILAYRLVPAAEASREARARAAGEPI